MLTTRISIASTSNLHAYGKTYPARMKADSIEFEPELTHRSAFRLPSTRSSSPSSSRSLGIVLSNVNLFKDMYGHGGVYGYGTRVREEGMAECRARGCRGLWAGTSRRRAALVNSARVTRRTARALSEPENGDYPASASEPAAALARIPRVRRAGEFGPRTPPQLASSCAGMERTRRRAGTVSAASASECALDSSGAAYAGATRARVVEGVAERGGRGERARRACDTPSRAHSARCGGV
ncbi:hypothetical protein C8F04DRAFT_1193853 [Mycena alexandri]|uniref:Uncharacterized protein n=1 Tax=Mycena alexandri TaxID=1745969 RepID=A0AAD6SAB9_9AGAR|nr:hypothetical protein C8F04DRAFT_1193853 [Mycena alexandri]